MARSLVSASLQSLQHAAAVINDYPFSMSARFSASSATAYQGLISLGRQASTNNFMTLSVRGDIAGDPLRFYLRGAGGVSFADTTSGFSTGVWHVATVTADASRNLSITIDGGSVGVATGPTAPFLVDTTLLGAILYNGADGWHFGGGLASAAIWGVVLNAGNIAALAKNVSPRLLTQRPKALWELLRSDADWERVYDMTPINAPTWADHPPMIYPSRPQFPGVSKSRFRLDPTGDAGTNEWTPSAGADHFAVVDDGLREPTDPASGDNLNDSGSGLEGDPTEELSYETSSMAGGSASLITVWLWGFNVGVHTGMDYLEVAIDTGGGFGAAVQIPVPIEERWHKAAFAGTYNQAAIDALVVRYTISNQGGGAQSYEFEMEQTYAEVTYTPGAVGGIPIFRRRLEAA